MCLPSEQSMRLNGTGTHEALRMYVCIESNRI